MKTSRIFNVFLLISTILLNVIFLLPAYSNKCISKPKKVYFIDFKTEEDVTCLISSLCDLGLSREGNSIFKLVIKEKIDKDSFSYIALEEEPPQGDTESILKLQCREVEFDLVKGAFTNDNDLADGTVTFNGVPFKRIDIPFKCKGVVSRNRKKIDGTCTTTFINELTSMSQTINAIFGATTRRN